MGLDLRLVFEDVPADLSPIMTHCPNKTAHNRGDKRPSLAVFPENVHCMACGFDLQRDAALAFLLNVDIPKALAVISKYTSEAVDGYRERVARMVNANPLPLAHAKLYNQQLHGRLKARLAYLRGPQRMLTPATIDRFLLGHNGEAFVIPVLDAQGRLLSLRYRVDELLARPEYAKRYKYTGLSGRNGVYPFPAYEFAQDTRDYVCLCEGEFDAMLLWQMGYPALTMTNGAGQMHKAVALLPDRITRVVIFSDNDEDMWKGPAAGGAAYKAARERGMEPVWVSWPKAAKDVTEAVAWGWNGNVGVVGGRADGGAVRHADERSHQLV